MISENHSRKNDFCAPSARRADWPRTPRPARHSEKAFWLTKRIFGVSRGCRRRFAHLRQFLARIIAELCHSADLGTAHSHVGRAFEACFRFGRVRRALSRRSMMQHEKPPMPHRGERHTSSVDARRHARERAHILLSVPPHAAVARCAPTPTRDSPSCPRARHEGRCTYSGSDGYVACICRRGMHHNEQGGRRIWERPIQLLHVDQRR